ncbi:MAG: hypothetical protein HY924_15740 [Elusimicrobia bacterium]|nr:hypothetical protein [Elusimicrobiota bacterium]
MNLRIGVDFDNTIACYHSLIHREALRRGLIARDVARTKTAVRDSIRQAPDGEDRWRKLQAHVYGPCMAHARLAPGARRFFETCRRRSIPVHVVSHKKARYPHDPTGMDFHSAAMAWMRRREFFKPSGFGLAEAAIHFEATLADKLRRIASLRLTHFIDDLEETLTESCFPKKPEKILYAPHGPSRPLRGVLVLRGWDEITGHIFHA